MNSHRYLAEALLFLSSGFLRAIVTLIAVVWPMQGVIALDIHSIVPAIQKIEEQIQHSVRKGHIPGCAVAVVLRDQIVFMNGYGVRSIGKKEKIDPDTVFQLGSLSKPIAATLASLLETHGLLNLDDAVSDYLPNFSLNSHQSPQALKIKNLLSHTSGIPRSGFNNLIESYASRSTIRQALQRVRAVTPVGRKYDYHNAMFAVIADVTQVATLQSFPDALSTKLLQPLQMNNTSATYEALARSLNRASPHTRNQRGALCSCEPYSRGYYSVAPAGGINSSARDMATFLKAQMGGFPQIVPQKALMRIQSPVIPTNNLLNSATGAGFRNKNPSYGLGWRIIDYANQKLVYHGGWLKGFMNFLAFMPEKQLGIVVLHNADTKFSSRVAMQFFQNVLGLPQASPSTKKPKMNKLVCLGKKHVLTKKQVCKTRSIASYKNKLNKSSKKTRLNGPKKKR